MGLFKTNVINKLGPNIKIEYKNGEPEYYTLVSTEELKLPSFSFRSEEDAKLVIAAIVAMRSHGILDFDEKFVKYLFRMLGISNDWT